MVTKIYIEGNLIDLFSDEIVELNSSIANTDDITKITSDYTKTFTVPASDRNNAIFKHYYNADIDNTFDARTKKRAYIELDGFSFKTGKIRLEKVSVKKGKASSYTINFWGDLVNFKDVIKDDELSSLDYSAFDHEQSSDNVREGLVNGLFGGDVVYTLMHKKQLFYDSTGNDIITDPLANIAYDAGTNCGVFWGDIRPSLRLLSIIELIEQKYGFTFSRDFFGRDEFKQLYIWVNNDRDLSLTITENQIDFTSAGNIGDLGNEVNLVNNYYVADGTHSRLVVVITPSPGYENVVYYCNRNRDGEYWSGYANLTGTRALEFRTDKDTAKHTFFIGVEEEFKFTCELIVIPFIGTAKTATQAEQTLQGNVVNLSSMPKIKIIDFLKGLIQMFKLVLIPNSDGSVYVNTINDYYLSGNVYDLTKYVDYDEYDVERGIINNVISFKYQEPQTILNKQFKVNTTQAYGDEEVFLKDSNGDLLDGESLEITLPFEQVVYERLTDQGTSFITNIQYGAIIDENIERVNPKPLIFYNNLVELGGNRIAFLNDSGGRELLNTTINTAAHSLGFDSPDFCLTFGLEYSTWDYAAISGTLYRNYWESYVTSIFNIKKRKFKFKAILPVNLLTKLQLNDVLFIKERYYRINDFTVNLLTGETTLNLFNTFENNFGLFKPSQTEVFLNYVSQTYSVYVSNAPGVMNIVKQDLGFGTSWATVVQNGSFIDITVTTNGTDINRDLFINVDNGSGKSFQIYLNQDNKVVTFDSTIVTFDSELITFDAE